MGQVTNVSQAVVQELGIGFFFQGLALRAVFNSDNFLEITLSFNFLLLKLAA